MLEPVKAERLGEDFQAAGRPAQHADIDGGGDLTSCSRRGYGTDCFATRRHGQSWIRLRLVGDGVRSNRSAIGAKVTLEAGGVVQRREVCGGRGYLSQSELTLTFGLGKHDKVDKITVRWPGKAGGTHEILGLAVDRGHVIDQKK